MSAMSVDANHLARSPSQTYRFGSFEVDPNAGQVRKGSSKLRVPGQSFEILHLLLEHPGEVVTRKELRGRLWPDDTFVDFDHGLNAAINKLREVLADSAERPRYIETLPRRGYRFIAEVRVGPGAPLRRRTKIALKRIRSLAVLPLENLSGDPEQEYFVDGMTEALITNLAKIRALRVISRASVMRYKGTRTPLREIAQELNVDGVVEGSVLRVGEHVRISAQFLHASFDAHLWAESYERDIRDVFALQAEVAQAIAAEIRIQVTPRERKRFRQVRKIDPKTYEAYLLGRFFLNKRTPEGVSKSLVYFQKAIERDPGYALAYAGLADTYVGLGFAFHEIASPLEVMPKARAAAKKALEIDESLGEAHATLAFISTIHDYDWEAAERGFTRALALNPGNARIHHLHAAYLSYQGRLNEAQAEIERARETDPLSVPINNHAATVLYFRRDYDQAIERSRRTLVLDASFPNAHLILSLSYQQKRMYADAMAEAKKAASFSGRSAASLGCIGGCYAALGRLSEAKKVIKELQALSERKYVSPFVIAWVYVNLRDKEAALAHLEQAYAERSTYLPHIKIDPSLDSLRSDSRFQDLLRHMNLQQ
ncbi:MAG TPA: winged helix-turn-helix domain-containing protein [Candidatus Acidoferrales bacterium]|nr:winged helix-turn-helix domain-containing protein [Candidatus Acidoferrales bacterium]